MLRWVPAAGRQQRRLLHASSACWQHIGKRPAIAIENATFYRDYPKDGDSTETHLNNPALFPDLNFTLRDAEKAPTAGPGSSQYWAIVSPSSVARTTFLQILAGQHICIPPKARSYPLLSDLSTSPHHAIKYVGFDADRGDKVGGTNVRGAYLSARYESRREETDFTVHDYLTGHTELNALESTQDAVDRNMLAEVIEQLNLGKLMDMPVANLSNGQTRRARIAKALMSKPEILLLDGPFMGLDPNTLANLSNVLKQLAERNKPRLIMSLRPEDGVPAWVNNLCVVDGPVDRTNMLAQGEKDELFTAGNDSGDINRARSILRRAQTGHAYAETQRLSRDAFPQSSPSLSPGEALVEMQGVKVSYGSKTVLGDWQQSSHGAPGLWWSLHRGQRCGIFGANGSGKTTMLSLITSDHPQTYSLPIKLFGRSRLPDPASGTPGIGLFDLQKRMGHSSPEVHAFFPRRLTVRRAIESAWADTPIMRPKLDAEAKRRVDACLRWFARELNPQHQEFTALERLLTQDNEPEIVKMYEEVTTGHKDLAWADDMIFGELSFSSQRLALFLRAIVAQPDLVILDEALSGMDEAIRDKALLFLSHGETVAKVADGVAVESPLQRIGKVEMKGLSPEQALLVISHAKEDVPGCVREWICLPEPGEGKVPRSGTMQGPLELNSEGWEEIWGKV